jgi:hypothetical protein
MDNGTYININEVAKAKGLKSNRSLRLAIQRGKYIARTVSTQGGLTYEILLSSLEIEIQKELTQCTSLVPIEDFKNNFVAEDARLRRNGRLTVQTSRLNVGRSLMSLIHNFA